MPYIGRDNSNLSNVEVLDNITFDGSSSYTLQKGGVNFTPSSANNILISIDGVVQAGNFTVSSSTIDFGTAVAGTSTCDFILHYGTGLITTPADGTVTTAKLADSSVSLAKLTATGTKDSTTFLRGDNSFAVPPLGGITEADFWRVTTNFSGSVNPVASNWERCDDDTFAKIGTGMSQSSGVWTFPSTGLWYIVYYASFQLSGAVSRYVYNTIETTPDNSTWTERAVGWGSVFNGSDNTYSNVISSLYINVDDTANDKVRFGTNTVNSSVTFKCSSTANYFSVSFIRLGDAQ